MAASASPDLVVLDLGLPDAPGETVARELRCAAPVPILMLTVKSAEEDRIRALELICVPVRHFDTVHERSRPIGDRMQARGFGSGVCRGALALV